MDQISQIKQSLDIVDIVSGYVSIKKSGHNYKGLCPFHSEKTPSFMVSPELQIYKCFGCGASGDIFKFVEQIEGVEFSKALEILADRAGIKLEKQAGDPRERVKKEIYKINDLSCRYFHYILTKHQSGREALEYLLNKRGLNIETIDEFNIGYAPESWDALYKFLLKQKIRIEDMADAGVIVRKQSGGGFLDKFKGRIMFPLMETDGKIVGFTGRTLFDRDPKYLNTSETPVFHKTSFIYGLDKTKVQIKKEGAVFVEGQMDLVSAYQRGIRNVVSVSGTSLTENQLKILSRYTKNITFCFDSDLAGMNASQRAIDLAEKQGFEIKVAVIPAPHKDLDDLVKADVSAAQRIFLNAVPIYDFFILLAVKKHDKTTGFGKRAIIEEITEHFSSISNKVLFEHYAKKIAEELDLSEETVASVLRKEKKIEIYDPVRAGNTDQEITVPMYKQTPEAYFIALLIKMPLISAKEITEKLDLKDFLDPVCKRIMEKIKDYLQERKKQFNITSVLRLFDGDKEAQELVSDLYLWDIELENEEKVEKEAIATKKRIRMLYVKKSLKDISELIKQAEIERDSEKMEKLTKKFERLSKELI